MADDKKPSTTERPAETGRSRSPNYPSLGLADAIKLARTLWDKEKRTVVSADVVATAWGYKALSGPARSAIATLRQYGLLSTSNDGFRVSDLALDILHQPEDSDERASALRTAATNPRLFKELASSHVEASDDALRAYLITRKDFSEDAARRFLRAFRETVSLAKLTAWGYNAEDMASHTEAQVAPLPASPGTPSRQVPGGQRVTLFSWPLSRGVTAEVRFVGDDPTAAHLERLRQYLELAKVAVSSDEENDDLGERTTLKTARLSGTIVP